MQGQHRATLLPSQLQTSGHSPTSNQDGRPAAMTTDLHVPAQTGTHHRLSRQWRLAAQIGYTYELLGQSPITLCKALGRNTQPHRTAVSAALCCLELKQGRSSRCGYLDATSRYPVTPT